MKKTIIELSLVLLIVILSMWISDTWFSGWVGAVVATRLVPFLMEEIN